MIRSASMKWSERCFNAVKQHVPVNNIFASRGPLERFVRIAWQGVKNMSVWLIDMGYVVGVSGQRFKIDYIKSRRQIQEWLGEQPTSVIFNSVDPKRSIPPGLAGFYETMRHSGFTVNLYEMEGGKQRMVDVAITSQAVWYAARGQTVVLTTGDIDFLPVVELITKTISGKLILFAYEYGVHEKIAEASSEYWTFESMRNCIEKR